MNEAIERSDGAQTRLREEVEAHADALLRLCYIYLRDRALAEDIVQETFLRAWKHWEKFDALMPGQRRAWLSTTAINLCRDTRRTPWFRVFRRQTPIENVPPEILAAAEEDRALLIDVCNLPERYRQVLLLYYYQELTTREIARALGISAPAVSKRLEKARKLLRGQLEEG